MKMMIPTLLLSLWTLVPSITALSTATTTTKKFPIAPVDLICEAKHVLNAGIGTNDGGDCLADSFSFCAAVVGPIGKTDFLNALASFQLADSWKIEQENFGFTVSPVQPNRVYWLSYQTGTMIADFLGAKFDPNLQAVLPPQCFHLDFDESGKVTEFGFYTVDRQYGNTGGLGGAFGYMHSVNRAPPIPEAQPYRPSKRFRLLNFVSRMITRFSKSNEEQ